MFGHRLPGNWSGSAAPLDFYDAKGVAESLLAFLGSAPFHFVPTASRPYLDSGKAADIVKDGEVIGWVGAVRRELQNAFEIPATAFYGEIRLRQAMPKAPRTPRYKPVPRFPPVFRDFSCVFPAAIPVGDVLAMVREISPEIEAAAVFDVYTGEKIGQGMKSVAFRIKFQPEHRTLTDAEVNSIHTKVVNLLENRFGGRIRTS
jgi:phenylalanyl-tRNA synthetase beta chain